MKLLSPCLPVVVLLSFASCAGVSLAPGSVPRAERACEAGDTDECNHLAYMFTKKMRAASMQGDPAKAIALLDEGCQGGTLTQCFNLGILLLNGPPAIQDSARARSAFEVGCRQQDARNCSALGMLYRDALGGPQDIPGALQNFELACEADDTLACINLAAAEREGLGGTADPKRAAELYGRACDAGSKVGCEGLRVVKAGTPLNEPEPRWRVRVGTATINGMLFDDVVAGCASLDTMWLLTVVSDGVSACLDAFSSPRVEVSIREGVAAVAATPDDAAGQCVANLVRRADYKGECPLAFTVRLPPPSPRI